MNLKIVEIFYSLQGEGGRQGEASIFIRLSNCNKNCWFCDTDWSKGDDWTVDAILNYIQQFPCQWIVWTGGEPTLQLTDEIVGLFHASGYSQAIETNGTNYIPEKIDYITCSPKVDIDELYEVFTEGVNEFRFPIGIGDKLPDIHSLPSANDYYISPIFTGDPKKRMDLNQSNVNYCIELVKKDPRWKLSLQIHKLIGIR